MQQHDISPGKEARLVTESRVWELERPGIAWLLNYCLTCRDVSLFTSAEWGCVLPFPLCLLAKPPLLSKCGFFHPWEQVIINL